MPILGTNLSATFTSTTNNSTKGITDQQILQSSNDTMSPPQPNAVSASITINDPQSTNDDTEIQTLDISSNLHSTLEDDNGVLAPLSTSGTYDSVLTEPMMTLAPTDQKIDIIS